MEREITCPSGMKGRIRPIKVKDEKLFTDARLLKSSGGLLLELCKRCWLEVTDPGPYSFPDGKVDWNQLLQGDVFYTFLQIRMVSYGAEYEITLPCRSCRNGIDHTVNLETDLRVQPLTEESRAKFQAQEPLQTELGDGTRVFFKLLTYGDEKKIERIQKSRKLDPRNALLAGRITAIEGLENEQVSELTGSGSTASNPFEIIRFVEDLAGGDADLLRESMEEHDCGVDTDFTVVCDNCFYEQAVTLPLEANFFQRRKKKTVKRTQMKQMDAEGRS